MQINEGGQREKRRQKEGEAASLNEPVKGKRKKGRKRREINELREQRCALYRKWTYPAVPPIQLYPETLQSNNCDRA